MNGKENRRYLKWALLYVTPNMVLFTLFFAIPAILGIYFSLTNYNGFNMMEFVGLDNYVKLLGDKAFYKVVIRTTLFVAAVVPLIYVFSLMAAMLFTSKYLKFKSVARVLVYIPTLFSTVLVGLTWRWIFGEKFGLINYILQNLNMEPIAWSTNPQAAFITTLIASVWGATGFFMLIFIGGIENIDRTLYEAATIDGANSVQQFRFITLPQLRATSFLVIVLNTIGAFKAFAMVVSLTNGGPGVSTTYIVQYIYQTGFDKLKVGYASAASMMLFIVLMLFSIVQFKLSGDGGRD